MQERSENTKQDIVSGLGGILVGIAAVIIILLSLSYFHIIKFPFGTQEVSPTKQATKPITPLESCQVNPQEHPLVFLKKVTNGITTGIYNGSITSIDNNTQPATIRLNLISETGQESHTFIINKNKVQLYSSSLRQYEPYSALHIGESISMNFDCNPHIGTPFRIFSIGM